MSPELRRHLDDLAAVLDREPLALPETAECPDCGHWVRGHATRRLIASAVRMSEERGHFIIPLYCIAAVHASDPYCMHSCGCERTWNPPVRAVGHI